MATSIDSITADRILFTERKLVEIRERNPNLTLIEQMRELLVAYKEYIANPELTLPSSSMKRRPTTPTNSPYNGKRMCLRSDDAMDVDA